MADLDVVKKRKSPLPWIILALIIVALLAFLLLNNNDEPAAITTPDAAYDSTAAPATR